jgi:hypothetical protein
MALYAASVAAAIITMCLLPSSLNNYTQTIQPRFASFMSFPDRPAPKIIVINGKKEKSAQPLPSQEAKVEETPSEPEKQSLPPKAKIKEDRQEPKKSSPSPKTKVEEIKQEPAKTSPPSKSTVEEDPQEQAKTPAVQPVHGYFIVVASLSTGKAAGVEIQRFIDLGFKNAFVRSSGNRHRVCIASFAGRKEAETFLQKFRKEYPQYSEAWLLVDNG